MRVTHHPLLCSQNPQNGSTIRAGRGTEQLRQDTLPDVFPLRHRNFKYVIKQRCHCLTALDTPTPASAHPLFPSLSEVQGQVPILKSRVFQKLKALQSDSASGPAPPPPHTRRHLELGSPRGQKLFLM